ncbi:MAG: GTP-binding protein [Candidatus Helarchaeota archaeon]
MNEEFDYLFKIIVVGDGGVGKTALAVRFAEGIFREDYKMTIGVDFSIKTIDVHINNEVRRVKFQIWDTGGQERFSYTRPLYYKGAVGALIVYDITNRQSFENLDRWFNEVRETCFSIPILLIGNKADLPDRTVAFEEAEALAASRNIFYYETSAKSAQNVDSVFHLLGQKIVMVEEGLLVQETVDQRELKHKEYLDTYMSLADQAFNEINNTNYREALRLLKDAYGYAKEIGYQDGMKWIEEQTQLILKILKQQEAQEAQKPSLLMFCAYCNKNYAVSKIGKIYCPICGNQLMSHS